MRVFGLLETLEIKIKKIRQLDSNQNFERETNLWSEYLKDTMELMESCKDLFSGGCRTNDSETNFCNAAHGKSIGHHCKHWGVTLSFILVFYSAPVS